MSAAKEIDDIDLAREIWADARRDATKHVKRFIALNLHKQIPNRLLEPFSSITVICSGTDYENFFEQRCHPDSQPEMQALANRMKLAYTASKPKERGIDEWHMPFIDSEQDSDLDPETVLQVGIGRCARVSYLTHEGIRDPKKDVELFQKLWCSKPKHLTPLEHFARVAPWRTKNDNFYEWASVRHEMRTGALIYRDGKLVEGRGC
jgi:hypothetical protein